MDLDLFQGVLQLQQALIKSLLLGNSEHSHNQSYSTLQLQFVGIRDIHKQKAFIEGGATVFHTDPNKTT